MVTVEIHETEELDFARLMERLCGGARDNALAIADAGKGDEFMKFLDEYKDEEFLTGGTGYWTLTQINDALWFGFHNVAPYIGMEVEE